MAIDNHSELMRTVASIVNREIRPSIQGHGGNVEVTESSPGVIRVRFYAACSNCGLKTVTFAGTVRPLLLEIDGVEEVICEEVPLSDERLDRIAAFFA